MKFLVIRLPLAVIFFSLSFVLFGQTIMTQVVVHTPDWEFSSSETRPDSISVQLRELMHTFESGVMEALFDMGMICFNNPPIFQPNPMSLRDHGSTVLTARTGGAQYVVVIETAYSVGDRGISQGLSVIMQLINDRGELIHTQELSSITPGSAFSQGQRSTRTLLASVI